MNYELIFLRKEGKTLIYLSKLKMDKINEPIVNYKNKKYVIDLERPTYVRKTTRTFFLDYDSGSQFNLGEVAQALTPAELDMIIGNKIIRELTSGVIDNRKEKIMLIILGAIVGGLLTLSIAMMWANNKIEDLLTENTTPFPPVIPTSLSLIKTIFSLVRCL